MSGTSGDEGGKTSETNCEDEEERGVSGGHDRGAMGERLCAGLVGQG